MNSISVVIPCYNCESDIIDSVDAILGGTLLPMEIILIDDCSSDATLNTLEALSKKYAGLVKIGKTHQNIGPAGARNLGAKLARGSCLFFLDSDTRLQPCALTNFSTCIEQYDAVVGIYDQEPINSGISPRYKALLYSFLLGQKGIHKYDQFSASCAGIHSNVFWNLGGYDERFPSGLDFENEEFGHRISDRYCMVLNPLVCTQHRFPGFRKMTRTFFFRTALWGEMFILRRKFSSSAGTKTMGISSLALLVSAVLLPLGFVHTLGLFLSIAAYLIYLYGYVRFYVFVINRRTRFLLTAIILNHYYTLVIACGAMYGLVRIMTGDSQIIQRFSHLRKTQ